LGLSAANNVVIHNKNKKKRASRSSVLIGSKKIAESTLLHVHDLFNFGQVLVRREINSVCRYNNNTFKGLLPVRDYF